MELQTKAKRKVPTKEQQAIIDERSNCVVIAQPGSGKTYTLAIKIKNIISDLPSYKGVIAISYTNKASDELKTRCLNGIADKKGSFFGTIDKFFISEIVIPFGKHAFGMPKNEIKVVKAHTIEEFLKVNKLEIPNSYENLNKVQIESLKILFQEGYILLEAIGVLALFIFDNSLACRKYLKARYSHVFIDEYQDSGREQHNMFLRLCRLGLCSIAVGDINQSIFAFSGKDSRYLYELTKNNNFKPYPLSLNHRCHPSIINYSNRLLSPKYIPTKVDELRVYEKKIIGSEIEIAKWIDEAIPIYLERFSIKHYNKVGILTRSNNTAEIIHRNLEHENKLFVTTAFDEDSSSWAIIFKNILNLIFDPSATKLAFVEEYFDIDAQAFIVRKLYSMLDTLILAAKYDPLSIKNYGELLVNIAKLIYPKNEEKGSIETLNKIINSTEMISSFMPASENEVQIMTLHKSKGLEFDLVFHLDLYKWILPQYKGNYIQDLNLHYVGVTRAKECCVLCSSTKRHRLKDGILIVDDALKSEFMSMNNIESLKRMLGTS